MKSDTIKNSAIQMRTRGSSYGEIMKALGISSKGTLSHWFAGLELSSDANKRLEVLTEKARTKNLINFNKRRTREIIIENQEYFDKSQGTISDISKRELLLVGSALYWAEGVNKPLKKGYQLLTFVNSDPKMVKIFMRYLREILSVEDEKIKPGIIIHTNQKIEKAKEYWSQITSLSAEKFWVSVAVSSASKHKRPSNSLENGTIHLRVNDRRLFCTIKGYISGIASCG